MKLTALIFIIACMHVSAHSYSQTVSFSGKNVPLQAVFASIEKQTGLSFFFNLALMKDTRPVTLDLREVPLEAALHEVLKDQGLDFYKMGKTIFIVKKQVVASNASATGALVARQVDVRGKVTNPQGEPLVGATVTVKNGKKGTLTDENGGFELKNVPVGAVLEITYLGYKPREIEVGEGGMVSVELAVSNSSLDEAQVIAYGNTTQRLNTGDVTTVKASDIEKQPISNPLLALEGRVPGLFITQATGLSGSAVTVQIQGQNSILKGNDPLYVIDGVPYTSQLLPSINGNLLGLSGVNGGNGGNPLNYINPLDIESISVLKDADATAIYGSRAANGAILITTKRGKSGQMKLDFNLQNGWGQITRKLNLLKTPQYLQMRHEALNNDGITSPSATDFDINGLWDTTRNTDWQKVLLGKTAQYTSVNGSISGGTANTKYFVGAFYHRETSVFPGDFSDQKSSVHFNVNNISNNQKFRIQLSGSYMVDNNQLPLTDLTNIAITLAPDAPSLYNKDGSLNWAPNTTGINTWPSGGNPLAYLFNRYTTQTNNLVSNALLSYKVLSGFEIKSSFGYTYLQLNETNIHPGIAIAPENRPTFQRYSVFGNNNISSWIIEPQISYSRIMSKGKLEVLAGTTIEQNNNNGQQLTGRGYNSDLAMTSLSSAASISSGSTTATIYKYNAIFARLNYSWQEKFLLNFSARRDGSSRFGSANQFHDFEALGIAWVFSQESLAQKMLSFVSFGKLRASYGTTGNDQIGDYQYLNQYVPVNGTVPYQGTSGLTPSGLPNPYLQWEETKKLELGLDLGFLKDRLMLGINYFQNHSSNQLLTSALSIIDGFNSIIENFPATVQNSGLELSLNTLNIHSKNFNWSSNINFTLPYNRLLSFPNLANSSYASQLIVGQPITIRKVLHSIGVNDTTGKYEFADSKNNPTYNPSFITDRNIVENYAPKFYGGFLNSFRYKGFEFDLLLQFVKQTGINYQHGSYPGSEGFNQPVYIQNRWQKPGDIASIQKYNSNYSLSTQIFYMSASDAAYSDASYVRLKNLSLSYQLPEEWIKQVHLKNAKLYVQGQNLLTITHYLGIDPETQSTTSLPPLRTLTFGIIVGLY